MIKHLRILIISIAILFTSIMVYAEVEDDNLSNTQTGFYKTSSNAELGTKRPQILKIGHKDSQPKLAGIFEETERFHNNVIYNWQMRIGEICQGSNYYTTKTINDFMEWNRSSYLRGQVPPAEAMALRQALMTNDFVAQSFPGSSFKCLRKRGTVDSGPVNLYLEDNQVRSYKETADYNLTYTFYENEYIRNISLGKAHLTYTVQFEDIADARTYKFIVMDILLTVNEENSMTALIDGKGQKVTTTKLISAFRSLYLNEYSAEYPPDSIFLRLITDDRFKERFAEYIVKGETSH